MEWSLQEKFWAIIKFLAVAFCIVPIIVFFTVKSTEEDDDSYASSFFPSGWLYYIFATYSILTISFLYRWFNYADAKKCKVERKNLRVLNQKYNAEAKRAEDRAYALEQAAIAEEEKQRRLGALLRFKSLTTERM